MLPDVDFLHCFPDFVSDEDGGRAEEFLRAADGECNDEKVTPADELV